MSSVVGVTNRNGPQSNGYSHSESKRERNSKKERAPEEQSLASTLELSQIHPRRRAIELRKISSAISDMNLEESRFLANSVAIDTNGFLTFLISDDHPPSLRAYAIKGIDAPSSFAQLRAGITNILKGFGDTFQNEGDVISSIEASVRLGNNPHLVLTPNARLVELLFE